MKTFTLVILVVLCAAAAFAQPEILWTRHYGGADFESGLDVALTADGGYLLSGSIATTRQAPSDAYVIRLDSSGNILWSAREDWAQYDRAFTVGELGNGDCVVGAFSGDNIARLVRLNNAGETRWSESVLLPADAILKDGKLAADGGLVIGGGRMNQMAVLRMDSLGQLQWFTLLGGSEYDCGWNAHETWDHCVITPG